MVYHKFNCGKLLDGISISISTTFPQLQSAFSAPRFLHEAFVGILGLTKLKRAAWHGTGKVWKGQRYIPHVDTYIYKIDIL